MGVENNFDNNNVIENTEVNKMLADKTISKNETKELYDLIVKKGGKENITAEKGALQKIAAELLKGKDVNHYNDLIIKIGPVLENAIKERAEAVSESKIVIQNLVSGINIETRAGKNHNPGNIKYPVDGAIGKDNKGFAIFPNYETGFNALVAKIIKIQEGGSKIYKPDFTLIQYMNKYAPPSDNNNTSKYIKNIANFLNISQTTKIKDIKPKRLAEAHSQMEDGKVYNHLRKLGIIS